MSEWPIKKTIPVSCLIMKVLNIIVSCQYLVVNVHKHHMRFFPRLKEEVHVAPKKERRERDERRRENRGRRRERPQTIQSHSIFEQGPADTVRKTGA